MINQVVLPLRLKVTFNDTHRSSDANSGLLLVVVLVLLRSTSSTIEEDPSSQEGSRGVVEPEDEHDEHGKR
eukprot:2794445-Rhodomonas_salina.2